jgi:hypothetical protein
MITYTFYSDDKQADKRLHAILAALKAKYPGERITVTFEPGVGVDSASSDSVLEVARSVK